MNDAEIGERNALRELRGLPVPSTSNGVRALWGIALLMFSGGFLIAVIGLYAQLDKANDRLGESLAAQSEARVALRNLDLQIQGLERQIEELNNDIEALEDQVRSLGGVPVTSGEASPSSSETQEDAPVVSAASSPSPSEQGSDPDDRDPDPSPAPPTPSPPQPSPPAAPPSPSPEPPSVPNVRACVLDVCVGSSEGEEDPPPLEVCVDSLCPVPVLD